LTGEAVLGEVGNDRIRHAATGCAALVDDQHPAAFGRVAPDRLQRQRIEPAEVERSRPHAVLVAQAPCCLQAQAQAVRVADDQ
jgi:hypothetical protein